MKSPLPSSARRRFLCAGAALLVLLTGLVWRSKGLGLPPFAAKYGGDALWALLVYCGFAFLAPRATVTRLALAAAIFSWAVEFSQLWLTPWLDAVRATRLGHLVLGSTFNGPDLLAYLAGIALGAAVDRCLQSRRPALTAPAASASTP